MDDETLDAELTERLRGSGQRVTPQRLLLHRLVRARPQHLTADDVHDAASVVLPGVSIQTIYATLELFEQLGLVRRVPGTAGPAVFDSDVAQHHHAVCEVCGRIVDLHAAPDLSAALRDAGDAGFTGPHAAVVVRGRCAACAASRT
jgi:Fe2+ or Zn2+ uptake regulation protein